jgi:hypothetical protein
MEDGGELKERDDEVDEEDVDMEVGEPEEGMGIDDLVNGVL